MQSQAALASDGWAWRRSLRGAAGRMIGLTLSLIAATDPAMPEETILRVAELSLDATAIGEAVLDLDFEEARFRASMLIIQASAAGYAEVAFAASVLFRALGSSHSLPTSGYGAPMIRLADAISRVDLERPSPVPPRHR